MPFLPVIPFAVFFACCASQFIFLRQVRRALVIRHPDIWRQLSLDAWSMDSALSRFIWSRRDKRLNDTDLTKAVSRMWLLSLAAIAAWLSLIATLFLGSALRG